jgi:uncharacterized protein (TIGR03435 family)
MWAAGFLTAAFAQTAAPPAFEVASVKAADPNARSLDLRVSPGGRLTVTNLTLKAMVRWAYGVKNYQLAGGPSWWDTDRFDVAAKAEGEATREQVMAMLQTLLADRFRLKARRETREGNVYALVVGKNGPKLTKSTSDEFYIRLYRNTPTDQVGVDYTIGGQKATMAQFADRLSEIGVQRPVLDRTGIQGEFDFKLRYATNDDPETGPSIFAAIQEQMGLKLEAAKGPVEMLVIESAEKPAGN